jgi:LmbE family N-acetylglucosaminyl deacetylase
VSTSPDAPAPPSVLVVGAHAFDAEAMAGGWCATLASAGSRIVLVHLSDGELGHRSLSADDYARQKRTEAARAARILGAEAVFFGLPDTRVAASRDVEERLARLIREVRPSIAIGHWKGTWHTDHRAAHDAFMNGLFLAALPSVLGNLPAVRPDSILFAENWEDAEAFVATEYRDITPAYDRWLQAIDAYELCSGSIATFPYRDYYTSLARVRGCLAGHRYAEAYMPLDRAVAAGFGIFAPIGQGDTPVT